MTTVTLAADDPIQNIPDPLAIRRLIGARSTELTLLRRLLKLAEDRVRLQPRVASADAILIPSAPTHGNR